MHAPRAMSLVDVVVGTALILIVFLALFGLLRVSVSLSTFVKDQSAAVALANSQMEYVRSLPYDSVGTISGIPAGPIPQNATTTQDATLYNIRTFIDYYDDPADGTGAADTNGITTDYKRIKVTVSYTINGVAKSVTLISNYAPPALETTLGGGTLQIIVVNANGVAVPGATVVITNASTSPTVNLTTFSDSTGTVYLPGAATSTQYAVTVSKAGYSTAQTYARDGTNQNPTPGYLTVVKNVTTTSTFSIDLLGTLNVETFSPVATSTFTDSFADASKMKTLTNTVSAGGSLTLAGGPASYVGSGTAISTTTTPAYLYSWGTASSTMNTPAGTTAVVQVVDSTGTPLPDAVLPGNAAGFTSFPIILYGVSTTTYPSLGLSATFTTTSSSTAPSITNWGISYQFGPTPLPSIPFTLTGAKTIGSTGGGSPIYKTIINSTTNTSGVDPLSLEWDLYSLLIPSYDVVDACNAPPFALSPGASVIESLILGTHTSNEMLVSVTDSSGVTVPNATVTVSRSGYTKTVNTSSCGTAYFGNISAANDYSVTISKTGYTSNTATGVTVSGQTFYATSF